MRCSCLLGRAMLAAVVVVVVAAAGGTASAQTGRVAGTVKDEGGEPIKGATVTAENSEASPPSFTATTDDKGRFGMIGLRTGRGPWSFTARAPGYAPQAGEMNVRTQPANNPPLAFVLVKIVAPPSILGPIAAKDLQADLAAADALYNSQRWEEAIAAYRTILAKAPSLSVINLQIAGAYRNKRDFDGAIAAYNDLLKTDPNNDKAKVGIAMTNLEKGDLTTAEKTLEIAAESPNATREVLYNLGEMKMAKSNPEAAAKHYERAAEIDPTWGKPVLALGKIALNRGEKDRALKYFEKVLEVDPLSLEAAQARTSIEQLRK